MMQSKLCFLFRFWGWIWNIVLCLVRNWRWIAFLEEPTWFLVRRRYIEIVSWRFRRKGWFVKYKSWFFRGGTLNIGAWRSLNGFVFGCYVDMLFWIALYVFHVVRRFITWRFRASFIDFIILHRCYFLFLFSWK